MKRIRQQQQQQQQKQQSSQVIVKKRRLQSPFIGISHGLQDSMIPVVRELTNDCFSKQLAKQGGSVQNVIEYLKRPSNLICWVYIKDAADNDTIVAMCNYVRSRGHLHNGEIVDNLITNVCTNPRYLKKGYMTFLLSFICSSRAMQRSQKKSIQYPILFLEVLKNNAAAISLYTKLGFENVKEYGNYYLMKLDLRFDLIFLAPLGHDFIYPSSEGIFKIKASVASNDCAIIAMKLLGTLTNDEDMTIGLYQYLKTHTGTPSDFSANIMSYKANTLLSPLDTSDPRVVLEAFKHIKPHTALPLSFYWVKNGQQGAHMTLVGRTKTGVLFCYEDQLGTFYMGEKYVIDHVIKERRTWEIYVALSNWKIHNFKLPTFSGRLQCAPLPNKQNIFQHIFQKKQIDQMTQRMSKLSLN